MHTVNRALLGILIASMTACSSGNSDNKTAREHDHVWKAQTDAISRAKQMEEEMNEAVKRNLRAVDEQ